MKSLEDMQAEVAEFVQAKGWNENPVTFWQAMALLHTEVSEAVEAYRSWGLEDATSPNSVTFGSSLMKPEGVGSEFADIFIRLLDDCERFGINLREEYERKMSYNVRRPYRHGGKRG